jgi:hypothetical protein
MEQSAFNLWSLVINVLTFIAIIASALFALRQLYHLRLARDVQFLQQFHDRLLTDEFKGARKRIYNHIPCPTVAAEQPLHEEWLSNRRQNEELFTDIETQLYEFDHFALFLRMAKIDRDLALDTWYDALARLTILLQCFIVEERKLRGKAFMQNFLWLLNENYRFIVYRHRGQPVNLYRDAKAAEARIVPITVSDLKNALDFLSQS